MNQSMDRFANHFSLLSIPLLFLFSLLHQWLAAFWFMAPHLSFQIVLFHPSVLLWNGTV